MHDDTHVCVHGNYGTHLAKAFGVKKDIPWINKKIPLLTCYRDEFYFLILKLINVNLVPTHSKILTKTTLLTLILIQNQIPKVFRSRG